MVSVHTQPSSRLNVLITEDRPHPPEHWTSQLPRLLEPQGIVAYLARSGREAIDLTERVHIHAAVIDMGTPLGTTASPKPGYDAPIPAAPTNAAAAGIWLLELFRRLPYRPPVVVVRGPAYSRRHLDRIMREALRLGAFSVVNKPVDIEQMLVVFRAVIDRRYRGHWPGGN